MAVASFLLFSRFTGAFRTKIRRDGKKPPAIDHQGSAEGRRG